MVGGVPVYSNPKPQSSSPTLFFSGNQKNNYDQWLSVFLRTLKNEIRRAEDLVDRLLYVNQKT